MQEPFEIRISNIGEIRIGAPYYYCDIELVGYNKVNLRKNNAWQDKYTWNDNYSKLVLVRFDLENNEPGFRFFIIDIGTGHTWESQRYFGLINQIAIINNKIVINKFVLDREKSKPGKLCCEFDEEFDIL